MTDTYIWEEGALLAEQPRLYDTCGLPNIWLLNGFTMVPFAGGLHMEVEDRLGLHREIALWLAARRQTLEGPEIKFIRRAMDLTQAELGHQLSTSEQTVARWEKGKVNIPGPEERLLRIIYQAAVLEPAQFAAMVRALPRHLSAGSEGPEEAARFRHSDRWKEESLRLVAA